MTASDRPSDVTTGRSPGSIKAARIFTRLSVRLISGCLVFVALLTALVGLQFELDQRHNKKVERLESLRFLPQGEVLRVALLGHQHLGADVIWLRIVQVLGEDVVAERDYEWLNHALDVVTTLDPQYVYAFDAGGTILAELAHRVDWSNRLLQKGYEANPTAWRLPFVLAFNQFFHLQDYTKAGEYMSQVAKIPGRPYYVDTLAARLYVEGGSPNLALSYLESMLEQTTDPQLRSVYLERYKEVTIARDLRAFDQAITRYRQARGKLPRFLSDLVSGGYLNAIPDEPFGGEYRLNADTGEVMSSTHPERLHLYRPYEANGFRKSI
jgi:tetratricopeptide (TPR) repeat protein